MKPFVNLASKIQALNDIAKKTLGKAQELESADDVFTEAINFVAGLDPKYKEGIQEFLNSELAQQFKDIAPEQAVIKGVPLMYEQINKAVANKESKNFFK